MNQVIQGLLTDFKVQNGIDAAMDENVAFEKFATFIAIEPIAQQTISFDDFVVAEHAQPDVDFLGVIVNGVPVNEPDEVDALADTNNYVNAHFIFGQAKTSSNFDVKALGSLSDFVAWFVTNGCTKADNERVRRVHAIWTKVYSLASKFDKNPSASLFYVTSGTAPPTSDIHFAKKKRQITETLVKTGNFETVSVEMIGSAEIQKRYKQLTNKLSAEIFFPKKVGLGEIDKVKNAFVGVIPASEFIKLIVGEAGQILQTVFYDNVRDWQGLSSVNTTIQATLKDQSRKQRFSLMNNGVTVIARKLNAVNDRLFLEDYQIVNGCQTSNVLARLSNSELEGVMVPLRVMETTDDDVVRDVIQATNNQTEVTQPQLLAVTDFQKGLESYFLTHQIPGLKYERRSRQYSGTVVDKTKIVTPLGLVKATSAMYNNEPHKTAKDFNSLLKGLGVAIFAADHKYAPYYVSALLNYWIDYFLRNGRITGNVRPARYQLMYAFRLINEKQPPGTLNSKAADKHAKEILHHLKDEQTALAAIDIPLKIIVNLMRGKGITEPRTSTFTEKVAASVENHLGKATARQLMPVDGEKNSAVKSTFGKQLPKGSKKISTPKVPTKQTIAKTSARKLIKITFTRKPTLK